MLPVDEHAPTHDPAVRCEMCDGDDKLTLVSDKFVCNGPHTRHRKLPIPATNRLRTLRRRK